jgi:hypothetical protein
MGGFVTWLGLPSDLLQNCVPFLTIRPVTSLNIEKKGGEKEIMFNMSSAVDKIKQNLKILYILNSTVFQMWLHVHQACIINFSLHIGIPILSRLSVVVRGPQIKKH